MHNYSTTEQRIGTWHNGKSVYEICYVGLSVTLNTTWRVLADVTSLHIDEIVSIDILGTYEGNKGSLIAYDAGQVGFVDNAIKGYRLRSNAIVNTVIVQYTKTTD